MKTGKYPEARAYLERALAIAQSKLGVNHLTTSAIMVNLADISAHENKWPDALAMLRRVAGQTANATEPGKRLSDVDSGLVRAIGNVSGGHPDDSLKNEAFVAAQRLHETQAGAALTLMPAPFPPANAPSPPLIRRP